MSRDTDRVEQLLRQLVDGGGPRQPREAKPQPARLSTPPLDLAAIEADLAAKLDQPEPPPPYIIGFDHPNNNARRERPVEEDA